MKQAKLAPEFPVGRAMIALAIAASAIPALIAPAAAFAQNVSCTACTHEVSYFKGKGGLIAKADGATEVIWVAQCGGVVRSGTLEANGDGIVSTLFDDDNNLACSTDDGRFRLGPVTDGGWYWITDDENSAVGNLVDRNILGNRTTALANAGASVVTAEGRGAVFVKETSTGRVGILPNILPVKPEPSTRKCGFTGTPDVAPTTSTGKTRIATNCKLGDGKPLIQFMGPIGIGGSQAPIPHNTIVRPYFGEVEIVGSLFMDGAGHFVIDPTSDPDFGWLGGTPFATFDYYAVVLPGPAGDIFRIRTVANPVGTTYGVQASRLGAGIRFGRAGSSGTYCGTPDAPKNHTMEVLAFFTTGESERESVAPELLQNTPFPAAMGESGNFTASATIRVVCPSSPEAQRLRRQGLMPEHLFRVE